MIDLHAHTTASDGTSSPGELVREAAAAGLDVVAITDHDTIDGWDEAAAAVAGTGVSLVRGMEVSAKAGDVSVHLLAYLFDPGSPELASHRTTLREEREGRARIMVERLGRDVRLEWDDVVAGLDPATPIGRPHIADALIRNGVVASREEAFTRFLLPGSPYYVPHYAPQALDVLGWVRGAGGKLVFAHPDAPSRGRVPGFDYLRSMAEAGMWGLEVNHRDNRDREALRRLARECELVETGSSDYHGVGKPNRLGEYTTAPEAFAALIDGAFLEVVYP